jgi:hypothetical protein
MRQPSKTEDALRQLEQMASGPMTDEAIVEIRRALNGSIGLLAARAAEIVGQRRLEDLIPDMIAAFRRLMVDGAKNDKVCIAKIAIADALNAMEYMGEEVFLAGAYYTQREPSFGFPIDAAVKLRCACAFGLARIGHPSAHYALADLLRDPDYGVYIRFTDPLLDPEYEVRAAAAKALAYMGTPEAELLLRLKVLSGDQNLEVIGECFSGLMTMSPSRSLDFAARFLKSENLQMVGCAALAIGQSHLPGAFEALKRTWEANPSPASRGALLLPIALVRRDEAFDFLLEVVSRSNVKLAAEAVNVLSLYADDISVGRVREAVEARGDAEITRAFERGMR